MLINVKVSTIVGIITFISMINTMFESLKARNVFHFQHFRFYEQLKFYAQLSMNFFYNLRARSFNLFESKNVVFISNSEISCSGQLSMKSFIT